jgi:hypothetical protein
MFDAEFTQEGDRCTAEVLMAQFAPNESGLRPVTEIVHEIDLKDAKFEHPETAGMEALITGVCSRVKDDDERLARASRSSPTSLIFFEATPMRSHVCFLLVLAMLFAFSAAARCEDI